MKRIPTLACIALISGAIISGPTKIFAQTDTPTPTPSTSSPTVFAVEGVGGDVDVHGRDPILSFSKEVFKSTSRISVDAKINNPDYERYPIRFEFFINNKLTSTQIRSKEIPAAIGLTLEKKEFPLPYTYTIIASLITPNRNFNSIAYGAMTGSELTATLSCTLGVKTGTSDPIDYAATNVSVTQADATTLNLSFTGTNSSSESKEVSAQLNVSGSTASGTVTYPGESGTVETSVSGKVTITNGNLSTLSVKTTSGDVTLSCPN